MEADRRKHPRLARPFEGHWSGASGTSSCRVADISLGGCFVQSLAMPSAGETTQVTIDFGDQSLTLDGRVAYVDPGMGFAVEFTALPAADRAQLVQVLQALGRPVAI